MAICKTCGKKYSKWVTPVSARGICADCFESELNDEREVTPEQDLSALEMVPTEKVATVVAQIGGPPDYIIKNWDRLVGTAQHLAELKAASG